MNYTFWHMAYKFGWSNLEGLRMAVTQRLITTEEFESITGEHYEIILPDEPPVEEPTEIPAEPLTEGA